MRVLCEAADVGIAGDVVRRQLYRLQPAGLDFAHRLAGAEVELRVGAGGVAEHARVGVDGGQTSVTRRCAACLADQIMDALAKLAGRYGCQHLRRAFCPELLGGKYIRRKLGEQSDARCLSRADDHFVVGAALGFALLQGSGEVELLVCAARVADHARARVHRRQSSVAL